MANDRQATQRHRGSAEVVSYRARMRHPVPRTRAGHDLAGGVGIIAYATRHDLTAIARACFWALVALIVFGIVLIFVQIPRGDLAYSALGLVIFAGFTMFDFQRVRTNTDIVSAPSCPRRSSWTS